MKLFISEAEIEDASMIIDYLNQVGGESDNLTYGLNECYLNEFEEMEVIQDLLIKRIVYFYVVLLMMNLFLYYLFKVNKKKD